MSKKHGKLSKFLCARKLRHCKCKCKLCHQRNSLTSPSDKKKLKEFKKDTSNE